MNNNHWIFACYDKSGITIVTYYLRGKWKLGTQFKRLCRTWNPSLWGNNIRSPYSAWTNSVLWCPSSKSSLRSKINTQNIAMMSFGENMEWLWSSHAVINSVKFVPNLHVKIGDSISWTNLSISTRNCK